MTAFLKFLKAEPRSPPIFLNLLVPKIRIMIEAPEIKVAKKYAADIQKLIESKS